MTSPQSYPHKVQGLVDLRSDTVTRPTLQMFEAMRRAPLGDDVLGDDPTVMRLEEMAADLVGKEDALFVPSGTMGNQCAIATHCRPGDALIAEEDSHVLMYEAGGPAVFAGTLTCTVASEMGIMDPAKVESRIHAATIHTPGTRLICLENSHNRAGGTVTPVATMAAFREIADRHGIAVHLDGARVFNAAAYLGVDVKEIVRHVDSVNFCLSKGLRAPVGSILCGTNAFIEAARQWRKRMGGGMRQAGILAACGIVSLTKMVDRLPEDHRRARTIAEALAEMPGLSVPLERVQTNIVMVETPTPAIEWQERLRLAGVLCYAFGPKRLRLVLHADIDDALLTHAIDIFAKLTNPS